MQLGSNVNIENSSPVNLADSRHFRAIPNSNSALMLCVVADPDLAFVSFEVKFLIG
jgi:hypothetical protein